MQYVKSFSSYDALSQDASDKLIACIENKSDAVICLATGATPLLTYQFLAEKVYQRKTDISKVTFVKLDEWVGLPLHAPGTCEHFLQQHVMKPLGLREEQLIGFRSEGIDEAECLRVTGQIAQRGGLDLCILGLGKNGHLGLNEPSAALEPFCHIGKLDEKTQGHDMLKTAGVPVEYGITLGLQDILRAKEVLLLIAGEGKQAATDAFMTKKVSNLTPASFLWLHDNLTCLLDTSSCQVRGNSF
jgi:6-phosphogluconolactonase/Glucosamine-6-phosphate isomerase/deaminase